MGRETGFPLATLSLWKALSHQRMLRNAEEIISLENHHLGNTTVITVVGQNHQWMVKLVGQRLMRNRIYAYFESISTQDTY